MMKHTLKFILIGLLCCLCNFTVQAQTRNRQYEEYIHRYKESVAQSGIDQSDQWVKDEAH